MAKKPTKTKKEKDKGGRPTDYQDAYADQARKLCLLGFTDLEMADFFGVAESTFYLWKTKHQKFSEAIHAGKAKADAEVVNKLYDRALGAEWIEDQAFKLKQVLYENGKKIKEYEEVKTVPVRKAAPPDTPAIALWLQNRQPSRWRKNPEPGEDEAPPTPVKIIVDVVDGRKPDAKA